MFLVLLERCLSCIETETKKGTLRSEVSRFLMQHGWSPWRNSKGDFSIENTSRAGEVVIRVISPYLLSVPASQGGPSEEDKILAPAHYNKIAQEIFQDLRKSSDFIPIDWTLSKVGKISQEDLPDFPEEHPLKDIFPSEGSPMIELPTITVRWR